MNGTAFDWTRVLLRRHEASLGSARHRFDNAGRAYVTPTLTIVQGLVANRVRRPDDGRLVDRDATAQLTARALCANASTAFFLIGADWAAALSCANDVVVPSSVAQAKPARTNKRIQLHETSPRYVKN
jgi:hypothetical protein